jgi:hypothetical protein
MKPMIKMAMRRDIPDSVSFVPGKLVFCGVSALPENALAVSLKFHTPFTFCIMRPQDRIGGSSVRFQCFYSERAAYSSSRIVVVNVHMQWTDCTYRRDYTDRNSYTIILLS